jgi:predicted transposase/invertase (TIGR01784 family)
MFDTVCKFLIENFSTDFASWLLGKPVSLVQLSSSELSLEPIRADSLLQVGSEEAILHLEIQTQPDPKMAFRMADYRLRVYRRFPKKAMRQVVIYLKPTSSALVYQTCFEIPGMRHEFEVVRLWEQPPSLFLRSPGLLPLAVLAQTEDRPDLLRQVANQIGTIADRDLQNNLSTASAILAGLRLEPELVVQILRQDIMQDSAVYQAILKKGREEGHQEGLQTGREEGLQTGREEGLQTGRQEGEAKLVLKLLTRRIRTLPDQTREQIYFLSLPQLEALGEALLDFTTLQDLEDWLAHQQANIAKLLESLRGKFGELLPDDLFEVRQLSPEAVASLETELVNWSDKNELTAWLAAQKEQIDFLL